MNSHRTPFGVSTFFLTLTLVGRDPIGVLGSERLHLDLVSGTVRFCLLQINLQHGQFTGAWA